MTPTLYGIPNCDTVKKARAWLSAQGVAYTFYDLKEQGVPPARLDAWAQRVGWENLLNRKGTTWRKLEPSVQQRVHDEATAKALMRETASVIKRPVVDWDENHTTVGFDADAWQARVAGP